MDSAIQYQRLRVPREPGATLFEPPLSDAARIVQENVARHEDHDFDFGGRSLHQLATQARRLLLVQARRYTRAYCDLPVESAPEGAEQIFLAGHQPQLFHPGVWLKNFVLGALARLHGAVGINLLIDNDTVRTVSASVPGGSIAQPILHTIPFDRPSVETPYEQRSILDRELFTSFGRRAKQAIAPLVADPLIGQFWPLAIEAAQEQNNLGQCLARARHRLEGSWGGSTLELPLGQICQTEPFAWFVAHLLLEMPRFHPLYNESLAEYRRTRRIRSRSHPVPDLAEDQPWLESPFWVWSSEDPRRRKLFVSRRRAELVLTDRQQIELRCPLGPGGQVAAVADWLLQFHQQKIKLRPRALITTMYARLFLSDLFLHGIGGAKYDQLTDLLMYRFFGLRPPEIMVISATALLPVKHEQVAAEDVRRIKQLLRHLRYHPEQHLDGASGSGANQPSLATLVDTKRRWTETQPPRGQLRQRHLEICRVNEALQPFVAAKREILLTEKDRLAGVLRHEAITASREYAFCLFPEKTLRPWILDVLPKEP